MTASAPETAALERAEAFLAARGLEPFPFQRAAWRAYLAGMDGLIHAPTGVGKTWAAFLGPLAEAAAEEAEAAPALSVLWVTPLRALAHDTLARLAEARDALAPGWRVGLRTSDTSAAERRRQERRLPTALVTTPESLSLLLSREDAPRRFAALRCVVVDEWHELLGSKRGVQTELGLARLRAFRPGLRTWGLSATIGNLAEARDALLGADGDPARRALVRGAPAKRYAVEALLPESVERFPWAGHLGTRMAGRVIAAIEAARSSLLFTNTRSQAERWFRELVTRRPDWLGAIALHHGSLDPSVRREVERLLRAGELKAVVCTSSLELGVDLSPVDRVLQVGSPKGVARLIQRAGRSGHRPGARSEALGVPSHALELVELSAARQRVAEGRVEARPPVKEPMDVLVQHLVTAAAGGGFEAGAMRAEVRSTHAFRDLSESDWRWCLDFAAGSGSVLAAYPDYARIRLEAGRYVVAGPRLARRHRANIGTINAGAAVPVRALNGRSLGTIEERFVSRLRPGDRFVFAGKAVELVRFRDRVAHVRRVRSVRVAIPRWDGTSFPLSTELAEGVRARIAEARDGIHADEAMRAAGPVLARQAERSRLPGRGELLVERIATREGEHHFLYPFAGRCAHEGLGALLAHRLTRERPVTVTTSANDYGLELLCAEPVGLAEADWRRLLAERGLAADLRACVNEGALARRQFRDIARIAGLVFESHPGEGKSARQLQASSDLFFDVLAEHDPDNRLLAQARGEVLTEQLEIGRLRAALRRIAAMSIVPAEPGGLTPLSFPLYADRLRAHSVSTEKWEKRMARMARRLETETGAAP